MGSAYSRGGYGLTRDLAVLELKSNLIHAYRTVIPIPKLNFAHTRQLQELLKPHMRATSNSRWVIMAEGQLDDDIVVRFAEANGASYIDGEYMGTTFMGIGPTRYHATASWLARILVSHKEMVGFETLTNDLYALSKANTVPISDTLIPTFGGDNDEFFEVTGYTRRGTGIYRAVLTETNHIHVATLKRVIEK